ncbi:MAG: hypothetical protein ACP5DC_02925 [Halothiobacillaceae bacterium]
MALIMVLWIIAALTLLSASLAVFLKAEVRTGQQAAESARMSALADGVLTILAAEQMVAEEKGYRRISRVGRLEGVAYWVEWTPVAGLVDLNMASRELLAAMLAGMGGLEPAQAVALAGRIVAWRSRPGDRAEASRLRRHFQDLGARQRPSFEPFQHVVELRLVPGVGSGLYERLRRYVTVESGTPSVNAELAPSGLVAGVNRGWTAVSPAFAGETDPELFAGGSAGQQFQLVVQLGEAPYWERVYRVELRPEERAGNLYPWRIRAAEPIRRVQNRSGQGEWVDR